MSEELNNELSLLFKVKRVKFLGFGDDSAPFSGANNYPIGITRRQRIEYQGTGVLSLNGIMTVSTSATTWSAATFPGASSYKYTLRNSTERAIIPNKMDGTIDLNSAFDNLADTETVLLPNEYLLCDFTSFTTSGGPRLYSGMVWGIEFVFPNDPDELKAYAESRRQIVPWL